MVVPPVILRLWEAAGVLVGGTNKWRRATATAGWLTQQLTPPVSHSKIAETLATYWRVPVAHSHRALVSRLTTHFCDLIGALSDVDMWCVQRNEADSCLTAFDTWRWRFQQSNGKRPRVSFVPRVGTTTIASETATAGSVHWLTRFVPLDHGAPSEVS